MSNNLRDLNEALFKQLLQLQNAPDDKLDGEIERTKGVALLSRELLNTASTVLRAEELRREYLGKPLPSLLNTNEN